MRSRLSSPSVSKRWLTDSPSISRQARSRDEPAHRAGDVRVGADRQEECDLQGLEEGRDGHAGRHRAGYERQKHLLSVALRQHQGKPPPPTLAVYNRRTHATTKTATIEYNQAPCCRGSNCVPLRVVRLSAICAEARGGSQPERVQERRRGGRSRERWRRPADTRESQLCRVPGPV